MGFEQKEIDALDPNSDTIKKLRGLKAGGTVGTLSKLKSDGWSAASLLLVGYTIREMKEEGGFSAKELRREGGIESIE